jgi:hypothetical protein
MGIICDTNIWYRLGDGRLTEKDFKGHELYATAMNIEEMYTSAIVFEEPETFIGGVKAIEKYASKYIEYEPIEFILATSTKGFVPTSKEENLELFRRTKIMANGDLVALSKDKNLVEKQTKFIQKYEGPKQKIIDDLNSIIHPHNKDIRAKYQKKQFRKKRTVPEILKMTVDIFSQRIGVDEIDYLSIDWENFTMFLYGWDLYFKEKSLDPNNKFEINDFYDLSNTAYVQRGDLYWTKDDTEPYRSMKKNETISNLFYNE